MAPVSAHSGWGCVIVTENEKRPPAGDGRNPSGIDCHSTRSVGRGSRNPSGREASGRQRFDRDDVVARTDLAELVRELSDGEGRPNASWFVFRCLSPTHDDRTPSFCVSKRSDSAKWKCFGCGVEGSGPIDVLVRFQGMSVPAAIQWLGERCGARLEDRPALSRPKPAKPVPMDRPVTESFEAAERVKFSGEYRDRLIRTRRWSNETIDMVGIELVRIRGVLRYRFPFRANHRPVYWQDRAIADGVTPKWLGPTGTPRVPFGADLLRRRQPNDQIVLLEGVPDVVTLIELFPGAAVIGVPGAQNLNPRWMDTLKALERDVAVIADNDQAGETMRARVRDVLGDKARDVYVPAEFNDLSDWHVAELYKDHDWFRSQSSARPGDVLEQHADLRAEGGER